MSFDGSVVGRWSEPRRFDVTPPGVAGYADAVGGPSPVYAVVPAMELVFAVAGTAAPAELRARVVHGQQDIFFHRRLPVGETVTVRAAVLGLHGKRSGTVATIGVRTYDADGALLNEQYVTEFYRGIPTDLRLGTPSPALPADAPDGPPLRTGTAPLPLDLPRRYADASGDRNPIHLDEEFARAAGLPGVIVHGLASLAVASHTVLADGAEPARLSCRFTRPIAPGDTLTTRVWADGAGHRFESVDRAGAVVLGAGLAELTRPVI
ncbi:MaoC/PaaZ C-terminal domain-containing protein [Plantactinospora sp. BB1]|uniref:MaoC/PaaZ C-terminal domain-containing protein n=1 Tax=Plantactinospora sp. BB1 TaxID=2071627 RepID=UPI000D162131|nr:MaoC/PaaZ C-terminal domain-containing protein [Plantactinospora sp. BB1]AVT38594.1 dehydratase [Plantactinospora sp. BB1]